MTAMKSYDHLSVIGLHGFTAVTLFTQYYSAVGGVLTGRHMSKTPASALQSEALPQSCSLMASSQQRCRRLCQRPLTDSRSDGVLPGQQQMVASHTAAAVATEKSLRCRQALGWPVIGRIGESVQPESGAPLSTDKL